MIFQAQSSFLLLLIIALTSINCAEAFRPSFLLENGVLQRSFATNTATLYASNANANDDRRPSIAIVGTGAVGGYYGARLWESQAFNVSFLMRGEQLEASKRNGFNVTSILGDMYIPPDNLQAYGSTEEIGQVDWVIVCLKSSALDAIPALVKPLLSSQTRILAIMNGLIDKDLVRYIKQHMNDGNTPNDDDIECCRAVYGGMALICSNRLGSDHVHHSYAGALSCGLAVSSSSTTISNGDIDIDRQAIEQLWAPTKVAFTYDSSLTRGRWIKNTWNLPFNGISVAMGGITIDVIVTDPGLRKLARHIMDETVAIANAELTLEGVDESLLLGEKEKDSMMQLSDSMGPYRTSTMIDFLNRKPMEVKYLFRAALDRAQKLNVTAPHLETVVIQIEALQRLYNLF